MSSYIFLYQFTQITRNLIQFYLLPISAALLDENVDPVGEHDGDHHQAREAGHEGEHAGVQLRVIRVAVVIIFARVPTRG